MSQSATPPEARYVYSIIHNYGYYLIDMPVYEDGRANCWELVDLDGLKTKIDFGWLSSSVPDNETLSIHHLGEWEIEDSKWYHAQDSYHAFLVSVMKRMNTASRDLAVNPIYTISYLENILEPDISKRGLPGQHKWERPRYFYKKTEKEYWLCTLNVYLTGALLLEVAEELKLVTLEEWKELIDQGKIVTKIPDHSTILIKDLGEIKIARTIYSVDVKDKLAEIPDTINQVNGRPTTSYICALQFYEYEKNPTKENRQKLKQAYEQIPKHLRRYTLGDMDRKDYPIGRAIYNE